MQLSVYWDSHQNGCGYERIGRPKEFSLNTSLTEKRRTSLSGIRPKTLRCLVFRSAALGSWPNALIAAGIEVPDAVHGGRRGVLRALRDAFEQHSETDIPAWLKLHAAYYFGSLDKAKAALKTARRFRAEWNKMKITAAIRKMHRLRKPLGYTAARRQNPALVSAAEAYLGTWGNTLYTAGIDPTLYFRRKWRKRRMIAKRDHTRYGNVPSSTVSAL